MLVQTWSDVITASFQGLWSGIVGFVPGLITAMIVFIVGWIVAVALGKIIMQIIDAVKVDSALESLGVGEILNRGGFKLNSGAFVGGLVRWFFILVFLLGAVDILGLTQVTAFLRDVVLVYIPNVIVAVLILLVAAMVAETVKRIVRGAAEAGKFPSAPFLAGVARWSIWISGILAALYQLGIAGELIKTIFTGFVAMLAIAGGLAFGLGGKDHAADFIAKLRKEISK